MSAIKLQLIPIFRSFPTLVIKLTTDANMILKQYRAINSTVSCCCHMLAVHASFVNIIAELILLNIYIYIYCRRN